MALDKTKLRSRLSAFFGNPGGVSSSSEAELHWANAYDAYAQGAEDVSGDGVATASRSAFLSALDLGGKKTPQGAADNFDRAFVAYWTGAVFAVGLLISAPPVQCPNVNPGGSGVWASETSSVVVSVTPGILGRMLRPIFEGTGGTAFSKAEEIARAFHEATTTAVTVLITGLDTTPPPTGPLSITNTCTIS